MVAVFQFRYFEIRLDLGQRILNFMSGGYDFFYFFSSRYFGTRRNNFGFRLLILPQNFFCFLFQLGVMQFTINRKIVHYKYLLYYINGCTIPSMAKINFFVILSSLHRHSFEAYTFLEKITLILAFEANRAIPLRNYTFFRNIDSLCVGR